MKMKHFTTEEWIDFVNQVSSPKQQESMKKHLGTGCKRCAEAVATWRKVHNTAAMEASYQPPAADVRIAKAAFGTSGQAKQRKEKSSLVEVLFALRSLSLLLLHLPKRFVLLNTSGTCVAGLSRTSWGARTETIT